jgi:hypothetical protein
MQIGYYRLVRCDKAHPCYRTRGSALMPTMGDTRIFGRVDDVGLYTHDRYGK